MIEQAQSREERERLHAEWMAHPKVQEFTGAAIHFVASAGLGGRLDAESMTQVLQFAARWVAEHGELPDSGILCN